MTRSPHDARPDTNENAARVVRDLDLRPHPEGGYYRETFRSESSAGRGALSSIHFLLPAGQISSFHRIDADEAWHLHAGDGVVLHLLTSDGAYERRELASTGPWQTVVPHGVWFAAEVSVGPAGYALVGCDVAPAFSFEHFELAARDALTLAYPDHVAIVRRCTPTESPA